MEGAERIMLGSNNYLGLTSDERVVQAAREALERYGPGLTGSRLLNGTTPLHLQLEQELAAWMGTDDAIVFTTGHQTNLGTLGTLLEPGDTVDRRLRRPRLDPRRLHPEPRPPSPVPPRAARQAREEPRARGSRTAAACSSSSTACSPWRATSPPLPEIVALCRRYGARLMVDEAHGAGVLGARGAGATELHGVESDVDLRMGTFSKSLASCGGFLAGPADVVEYLRAAEPRVPLHRLQRARRRSARRWPRCGSSPPTRGRPSSRACSRTPATGATGCASAASRCSRARRPADVVTPIVPVLVEDDWKAALLWKALWDAGVFVNVALHPAVPPGGALLRTSVMATHDAEVLDRALDVFSM